MSDNENQDKAPSQDSNADNPANKGTSKIPLSKDTSKVGLSKKTSAVPLMKETVRVSLKAADQKPAAPSSETTTPAQASPPMEESKTEEKQKPSMDTAAVPLMKDTMQVTLKDKDASSGSSKKDAGTPEVKPPTSGGVSTVPLGKAGDPAKPSAKAEDGKSAAKPDDSAAPTKKAAPAPTIPLRSAGGAPKPPTATKPAAPAPTIQLKTAGPGATAPGAKPAAPQPTIKLSTTNAPVGTTPSAQPGAKAQAGAPPKATVQLPSPTQPLTSPTQPLTAAGASSSPGAQTFRVQSAATPEAPTYVKVFAGFGLAAAVLLLALQLRFSSIWIGVEDNPRKGDWEQLIDKIE